MCALSLLVTLVFEIPLLEELNFSRPLQFLHWTTARCHGEVIQHLDPRGIHRRIPRVFVGLPELILVVGWCTSKSRVPEIWRFGSLKTMANGNRDDVFYMFGRFDQMLLFHIFNQMLLFQMFDHFIIPT